MNGPEFRNFISQLFGGHGAQSEAARIMGHKSARQVRRWCGDDCYHVPQYVIETLEQAMGQAPLLALPRFLIGKPLGSAKKRDVVYITHNHFPRFCCAVVPVNRKPEKSQGAEYACGNRLLKDFNWFDAPDASIQTVLEHVCGALNEERIAMY